MAKLWIDYCTKTRLNIQDERRENKKERWEIAILISDENSIARRANSAARDCLLRPIRSGTMTVAPLYKAELLRSSHGQESKNKGRKSVNR